jgi:hypothetical protein
MDGWMDGCVDGWMVGWLDGWLDGGMDGWLDVVLASLFSCVGGPVPSLKKSHKKSFNQDSKTRKSDKEMMDKNWLVGGDYIFCSYRIFHVSERR